MLYIYSFKLIVKNYYNSANVIKYEFKFFKKNYFVQAKKEKKINY